MQQRKEFEIGTTPVLGLPRVKYRVMGDHRGPFGILFQREEMTAAGLEVPAVDTINFSERPPNGVFGFHVSTAGKYITTLPGSRYFAAVADLRNPDDPSFGRVETFELEFGTALYVPPGYGNAGQALTHGAQYLYFLTIPFDGPAERRVHVQDAALGVTWPAPVPVAELSGADAKAPSLEAYARQRREDLRLA